MSQSENDETANTEQAMAACLRRGSEADFGRFYDCYASRLFSVLTIITPNREAAERVLQQTFIDIWRSRTEYNETRERLWPWIIKKIQSHVEDEVKSTGVVSQQNSKVVNLQSPLQNGRPIAEALIALELVCIEGKSSAEAAQAMNIPLTTFLPLLRQALCQFKPTQS